MDNSVGEQVPEFANTLSQRGYQVSEMVFY